MPLALWLRTALQVKPGSGLQAMLGKRLTGSEFGEFVKRLTNSRDKFVADNLGIVGLTSAGTQRP